VSTHYDAARAIGVRAPFVTIAENLTLKDTDDRAVGGEGVWAPQMRELLAAKALIDAGPGEQFAAASMIGKCDRAENVAVVADVTKRTLGYTPSPRWRPAGKSDRNPPRPGRAHRPAGPPHSPTRNTSSNCGSGHRDRTTTRTAAASSRRCGSVNPPCGTASGWGS
jgi:hypothetical protein